MTTTCLWTGNDSVLTDNTAPPGLRDVTVIPKSPSAPSEDIVVITDRHVAVFDGMSSPLRRPGESPSGRAFALAAARVVRAFPADIGPLDAVRDVSEAVAGIVGHHAGPQGAVGAVLSLARREVWRVGDVNVRIGDRTFLGTKAIDQVFTDFRAAIDLAAVINGTSVNDVALEDPGLAAAFPLLAAQPAFANREGRFGYGVFNGEEIPSAFIDVFSVPDGVDVTLTSDGYPVLAGTLTESEARLHAAIHQDPACIDELRGMGKPMRPGYNAPDDRSYVQVHINTATEGTTR